MIPEKAVNLLNDPEATKVLTTVSKDGTPHSIVIGSMMAPDENTVCAAEILMQTTAKNLEANKNIAALAVKGTESYLVNAEVLERQVGGELFDQVAAETEKMGLTTRAVWLFKPTAVYDQSAGPNAGTKISG
ncbi:MAG TPA: hypothetical protein DHN33_07235 [Eubacteriaceae bacterium]|nr:hypothetical protein [Eubacteriaceae bacterium]